MPKVKYGTKEYKDAYNKRSLANYDFDSKTYNSARPLPDIVATPKNNLDLGQVVRNGTSKIGKPIGVAITELAALHPAIGLAKAGVDAKLAVNQRDKILNSLAALPIPIIKNLTKARKIISPVTKTVKKVEPGVTRISLNSPSKELGHIDLSDSFEKTAGFDTIYPEYIKVNEKGKGLSKALYAAGIKDMKKPIISGEVLLQPEKTVKTYKYFDGPVLPPLIMEEGYNYPRKITVKPKNPNLYEDTIKEYQNKTARYSNNLSELWKLVSKK